MEPTWTTKGEAAALFLRGSTVRTAAPIALAVGTILSAVNQGAVIANGNASAATWARVGVNFLVPFCVASLGWLGARRSSVR